MSTITQSTYTLLDAAYGYFNTVLWASKLLSCAITMQRKSGSVGYFQGGHIGFKDNDQRADEIALNPDTFKNRQLTDLLATLVHEMAHAWQAHFGKISRGGYHNQQWAEEMIRIGLQPSSTGAPGGDVTGQKMAHYIIAGGVFETACKAFISGLDSVIDWYSVLEETATRKKKRASKTKFTCPECGLNAWAKADAELVCGVCECEMDREDGKEEDE